jgi:hypothetical protein
MFPENREVKPEWLSEDQRYRYSVGQGKEFEGDTINCVTFFEKKNYVCSWSYLKFAISLGYEVTAFHTIAEFHADEVMSEYITNTYQVKKDLTAELNQITMEFKAQQEELLALPEEEQALLAGEQARKKEAFNNACNAIAGKIAVTKLTLNGCYGSTVIRQDRHSDTKLYDTTSDLKALKGAVSSLRFKSLLHAGGKTLINMDKTSYTITSPISLGSAILWESKILMLTFVYSLQAYLKDLGLSVNTLMTDTDSWFFHIPDFAMFSSPLTNFQHGSTRMFTQRLTLDSTPQNSNTRKLTRPFACLKTRYLISNCRVQRRLLKSLQLPDRRW